MKTKTILLIEDDSETQFLFSELLRAENYEVVPMFDGKEALNYLKDHHPPDLILMDLTFPTMTADAFVNELRKDQNTVDVPIILVSGKSDIQEYAERLKATNFIKKPFDIDPVLKTISSSINQNCSHP